MLRVIEVANKLGVSKVTIYKKIDKLSELKPYIVKKQKITYIKEEGIQIIKNNLVKFKKNQTKNILNTKWNQEINVLKDYLDFLKDQKEIKKIQLKYKKNQINNMRQLIKLSKKKSNIHKD